MKRSHKKKAQSSIEYLVISSFVLLMLLPLMYVLFNYSTSYQSGLAVTQLESAAQSIVDNAESVYFFGNPSQVVIEASFPAAVTNMTIFTNDQPTTGCTRCTEIRFEIGAAGNITEVFFTSEIEIRGPSPMYDETSKSTQFENRYFTQGIKNFRLKAYDDYVELSLNS